LTRFLPPTSSVGIFDKEPEGSLGFKTVGFSYMWVARRRPFAGGARPVPEIARKRKVKLKRTTCRIDEKDIHASSSASDEDALGLRARCLDAISEVDVLAALADRRWDTAERGLDVVESPLRR